MLDYDKHKRLHRFVRELNHFYLEHKQFWENDKNWDGFSWISNDDSQQSIISFIRRDSHGDEIIVVCNFCPVLREKYRIGVPQKGEYKPVFSSDSLKYGGKGTRLKKVKTLNSGMHGYAQSIEIKIPPLSTVYYTIVK